MLANIRVNKEISVYYFVLSFFLLFQLKSLFLKGQGNIHIALQASFDAHDCGHPAIGIDIELNKQSFHLELQNQDRLKEGTWMMHTSMWGKGTLFGLLVTAMHKAAEASRSWIPANAHEQTVPDILSNIDRFLVIAAPLFEWEGVDMSLYGTLILSFSGVMDECFQINEVNSCEIGELLLQKIKQKIGSWWGVNNRLPMSSISIA
jgi:hypothetical protein